MTQVGMIDVSSNNHPTGQPIEWPRVRAANFEAVMVKCTEGTAYVNPWLARDAEEASAAGLMVGYYHYAHPGQSTGFEQAQHAKAAIAGLPRALGLALDLEQQEGLTWSELAGWAIDFHTAALETVDHSPLYVNDYFYGNLPTNKIASRIWLAQTRRPRQEVWAWQLTTPGQVPGILIPTDIGWLHPDTA